MGIYLLQFFFKSHRLLFILIIAAFFIFFCSWGITKITDIFVPAYARVMSDRLKIQITFEKARYIFPKQIILRNVKIFDAKDSSEPMLEIPRVNLDFSFPQLFSKGSIHLDQMTLTHMIAHVSVLKNYLQHSSAALIQELKLLPQLDTKIILTDTKLYLPVTFHVNFSLVKGEFMGKFEDGPSFLQLWGVWKGYRLIWKGYMFYSGPLAKEPLNILDIDGRLNVNDKDISLEKMSFSINGDRFLATGHWHKDPHR